MTIQEHDTVILTRDVDAIDEHPIRLRAGDVGTVVYVHAHQPLYEVEFTNLLGETIAVVTLPADAVRLPSHSDMKNARVLVDM
jgi:hypothetical protein